MTRYSLEKQTYTIKWPGFELNACDCASRQKERKKEREKERKKERIDFMM